MDYMAESGTKVMKTEFWAWVMLFVTAMLFGRAIGNLVNAVDNNAWTEGWNDHMNMVNRHPDRPPIDTNASEDNRQSEG